MTKYRNIYTENNLVVTRGEGIGRIEEVGMGVKRYKCPVIRQISTRDIVYNMRTIVNTVAWCI